MFNTIRSKTWSPASSKPKITRPSHHRNDQGTAFKNPWTSANPPSWTELLLQGTFPLGWYDDLTKRHPETRDIKVVAPDWGAAVLKASGLSRQECVVGTTLGHAGAIVELPLGGTAKHGEAKKSLWILYDPIFSRRAGPTQYTGPGRMRPSPCQVSDLPGCDVIMISHNHYDHLDLATIETLLKKFPKAIYFVPLGNKRWLCSLGVKEARVQELDWWQNREYSVQDFGYEGFSTFSQDVLLRFTCVPAQHNSGRDVCPVFKEIGQKFGPFDLSFIPIWRGGTLGFISNIGLRLSHNDIPTTFHTSPLDAIDIHKDVQSRNTVAVHFGTFIGSQNESLESIMEFEEARDKRNVLALDAQSPDDRDRAGCINIGASFAARMS
ncbi:Metallo-hydrolase/oxidoreductase [Calycina marina]|uniref:Metallo-hydrolase/oxidoreductase n=1 Tax=Calycina marina TaxID=1763456 RepID=A0A9P7Z8Y2_9HELO|nr:Metallo-hydrolase/oxidoreductase [Calycina marina]